MRRAVGDLRRSRGLLAARLVARGLASSSRRKRPPAEASTGAFWHKDVPQAQFWQDVGFDHDRASEARRSPLRSKHQEEDATEEERRAMLEERDDVYFGVPPSIEDLETEGLVADLGAARAEDAAGGAGGAGGAADDAAKESLRDRMFAGGIDAQRRAELLGLIDDLGPHALHPVPEMPPEHPRVISTLEGETTQLRDEQASAVRVCNAFMDSVRMRESGVLRDGAYFCYLLHRRNVVKVGGEGKRMSHSVHVICGNGSGTAGLGMGKDVDPGGALLKATQQARKALIHIDRFDDRTMWHDQESFYAATKAVIRLRRAGSGTRCNWMIWKMLSAFGITDVSVKVHGSRNNISQAKAMMNAFLRMQTAQMVADRRSMRVIDLTPRMAGFHAPKHAGNDFPKWQ